MCGRRLSRHGLTPPLTQGGPAAAAAAMCGTHAQVLSAAEVSIGLRLHSATRTDVQDALWSDHSLVKTFGPRGTVHLLPASDLSLWCGALGALPAASRSAADVRITEEQTEELVSAIGAILADAELTVDELTEVLADQVGSWAADPVMPAFQTKWPRWRQMTETAAHRGVLCFGMNKGRKVTYTNPARWLPGFTPAPHSEAIDWLLGRYLHAYGPATPRHFARWLAATPAWARGLFENSDLTEVSLEGIRAWVADGDSNLESLPRASCCCRTSTRSPSDHSPGNCSTLARRGTVHSPGARQATTPYSWSTAPSQESGTRRRPARTLPSPSSRSAS